MEERIIELETRLAFQEDLLQKLDDVIIRQQQEIDELKTQLIRINQQLSEVGGQVDSQTDAPPPHY
jgi:SlyX protein